MSTTMSNLILLLFFFGSFQLYSQYELNEIDTSLHFKKEFYKNGVISIDPYYSYFDSTTAVYTIVSKAKIDSNAHSIDTSEVVLMRHGKWNVPTGKEGKVHYLLVNYERDYPIGKGYEFDAKNNLVATYTRYPTTKDSTFNGYREINYKAGKITSISYFLFSQDKGLLFYWNNTHYFDDGTIRAYYFEDEEKYVSISKKFNRNGALLYDRKKTRNEWYTKKWRFNRRRLKVTEFTKSEIITKIYRKGVLIREKKE